MGITLHKIGETCIVGYTHLIFADNLLQAGINSRNIFLHVVALQAMSVVDATNAIVDLARITIEVLPFLQTHILKRANQVLRVHSPPISFEFNDGLLNLKIHVVHFL